MDAKHRIGIALLLAGAAAASTVGIAQSVSGGEQPAVEATTTDQAIEKRQAALDKAEREIAASLAERPPKLPVAVPPASAPPVVVVTRRSSSAPAASGVGHDDDDEYEDEDEHEDEDGGHEGGDDD